MKIKILPLVSTLAVLLFGMLVFACLLVGTDTRSAVIAEIDATHLISSKSSLRPVTSHNVDSFDWTELELTQGVSGNCGADKCFWRSTSDPESVGYLVASAKDHYARMKKAYDFAIDVLETKCLAKHLFLEAPIKVPVKKKFLKRLNALRDSEHAKFVDGLKRKNKAKRTEMLIYDENDLFVVVQKVRVAPKPSITFGYMARKWDLLVDKHVPRFRSELLAKQISLRDIEVKLESERKGIECAMQHSHGYWYDLQGLIDLDGNYYHMDIDSQFWVRVEGSESEDDDDKDDDNMTINMQTAYRKRQVMIGKFNEMIQRIVDPPPDGVHELSAWGPNGVPYGNSGSSSGSDDGDDDDY